MREKILLCARNVFNKKGIQQSTLRDIATYASISDGHLRYYFKTKEELILAVFSQMDEAIVVFAAQLNTSQWVAQTFVEALTKSFEVMHKYGFFFMESTAILKTYPKVYDAYQTLIENRKAMLLNMFKQLKKGGFFTEEVDTDLFPLLFEQFFVVSDNWIKYARMPGKRTLTDEQQIGHYVALSIALFLPYFTNPLRENLLEWVKKAYKV